MKITQARQRKLDRIELRHQDKEWADAVKERDKMWIYINTINGVERVLCGTDGELCPSCQKQEMK